VRSLSLTIKLNGPNDTTSLVWAFDIIERFSQIGTARHVPTSRCAKHMKLFINREASQRRRLF
jgi:hypothetical protein